MLRELDYLLLVVPFDFKSKVEADWAHIYHCQGGGELSLHSLNHSAFFYSFNLDIVHQMYRHLVRWFPLW